MLATCAPTMQTVCYVDIFYQWVNGRDQIDCNLKITGTKLTATKI